MIGQTVSHYRIVGQLGAGGMGVVYAAEDDRLGRAVAPKFVPDDLAKDLHAIDRLRSEARTASALNHPNICTIFDIGDYEGRPFFAMELLEGRSLQERMSAGRLKVLDLLDLGIQVSDALEVAHQRGIIHRDIKPANLFLTARGHIKVLDFGLAKIVAPERGSMTTTEATRDRTAAGTTLGTVAYMSPEQVRGEELDGRTDLFSLGVVLYEGLTGRQPFTGKTSAMIFSAILTQAPVAPIVFNPEMPLRLQEVINNCLEKDRDLRYQDASALRADLRRIKRDLESGRSGVFRMPDASTRSEAAASADHLTSPPQGTGQQAGSRSRAGVAAAIAVAVLAVGGSFYLWSRSRTPADQPAAEVRVPVLGEPPAAAKPAESPSANTRPPVIPVVPPETSGAAAPARTTRPSSAPGAPAGPGGTVQPRTVPQSQTVFAPPASPIAPPAQTPAAAPTPNPPSIATAPPPPPTPAPTEPPRVEQPAPPATPPPARVERPAPVEAAPPLSAESDETAIRRLVAAYARAIETKDIALFKSVKPNLSGDEQRRIEDGFRAVTSQQVAITVLSIDVRAQDASVRLKRRDTIQAGGRQQTTESQQTMTLMRSGSGWVIREIGR